MRNLLQVILFFSLVCFIQFNALGQVPSNDICANATEFTCGTTLTNVDATTATSNGYPTECSGVEEAAVWYTFEGTGDLIDIIVSNETEDLYIQFFSGKEKLQEELFHLFNIFLW